MYDFNNIPRTGIFLNVRERPGFVPAADLLAWCVSKSATVVVPAKVDKTIDAQSGHIRWNGRKMESGPTRGARPEPWARRRVEGLKQGPQDDKSVRSQGRTAGVGTR